MSTVPHESFFQTRLLSYPEYLGYTYNKCIRLSGPSGRAGRYGQKKSYLCIIWLNGDIWYISLSWYILLFSLWIQKFFFFYYYFHILFNVVLQTMVILKTMKTIIVNVTIHVGCYCMLLWLMLFDREDSKVVWRHLVSVLHALSLLLNEIKGEESGHTSRPLMLQQEHTHCESTNCCRFP